MSGINMKEIRDAILGAFDSATGALRTTGGGGGGGSSSITSNTAIAYGAGVVNGTTQRVVESNAPNSIVTNPASSATSVVVLNANPLRKTVLIVNDSTQTLRLVLGATVASATNVSIILLAGGFTSFTGVDFSGEVRGIWAAANGSARVTETT